MFVEIQRGGGVSFRTDHIKLYVGFFGAIYDQLLRTFESARWCHNRVKRQHFKIAVIPAGTGNWSKHATLQRWSRGKYIALQTYIIIFLNRTN